MTALYLITELGLVFLLSLALSYFGTALWRKGRARAVPDSNAPLRIRAGCAVYRSHFLGENGDVWSFSAPLQRDSYVPIRVGESLVIEASTPRGVMRGRSVLLSRDSDTGVMTAKRPADVFVEERRQSRRTVEFLEAVKVEGRSGHLLNCSEHGAKIEVDGRFRSGERLHLDWSGRAEACAWVLESQPAGEKSVLRVRFEEPIVL